MTDQQLQHALAKMLPKKLHYTPCVGLMWNKGEKALNSVLDTELLHICWLVEQKLDEENYRLFIGHLVSILQPGQFSVRASWKQRAEASCKVKGITA